MATADGRTCKTLSAGDPIKVTDSAMDTALDPYDADPALDLDRIWTEAEYLKLDTNRLVEFVDGTLEFLPMPDMIHQLILYYLHNRLNDFMGGMRHGVAVGAPFKIKIGNNRYREPDIAFKIKGEGISFGNGCWDGAALVIEIVSDSNRQHDLETKRREYARAGIPEYLIVDPREETITVLKLEKGKKSYAVHGIFKSGKRASSVMLAGFEVYVAEVFDQKPRKQEHEDGTT